MFVHLTWDEEVVYERSRKLRNEARRSSDRRNKERGRVGQARARKQSTTWEIESSEEDVVMALKKQTVEGRGMKP